MSDICKGILPSLQDELPAVWWTTLFDEMYLKTDGDVVEDPTITKHEVEILLKHINFQDGDAVLDLCCGQGRHSLELFRQRPSLRIAGLDQSRCLIDLARRRSENLDIPSGCQRPSFTVSDCRSIPFKDEAFDHILVMGNSFGYFESEDSDLQVLAEIMRVLKPGGSVMLDLTDGDYMRKNFAPRSWEWIDNELFVCRERQLSKDVARLISREIITNTSKGVIRDQLYAERLYSKREIFALLAKANFVSESQVGSLSGEESERNQDLGMMAHRLLVYAAKPSGGERDKAESLAASPNRAEMAVSSEIIVIMGDPMLSSSEKLNQEWNPEDLRTVSKLQQAVSESLADKHAIKYLNNHKTLMQDIMAEGEAIHSNKLIFNLCDEGFYNEARQELHVPVLLELAGLKYTGAAPVCLALCYDKGLVNAIAGVMGVPVPVETPVPSYLDLHDDQNKNSLYCQIKDIPYPAFIKPVCGDGSVGIYASNLVHNFEEARGVIARLREKSFKELLIQEFLNGLEVSVGIIGNPMLNVDGSADKESADFLPILAVNYRKLDPSLPKVLAYESKWDPSSPYWNDITYEPANLNHDIEALLYRNSTILFNRLGCKDYARFDWRADRNGQFKLMEVNPNPGWCWDGKLAIMSQIAGKSYPEMIADIVGAAEKRYEKLAIVKA